MCAWQTIAGEARTVIRAYRCDLSVFLVTNQPFAYRRDVRSSGATNGMWTIHRLANWRLRRIRKLGGGRKSPLDISNDVVDMLKADGKAPTAVGYAGGVLLFCRHLRVRGVAG